MKLLQSIIAIGLIVAFGTFTAFKLQQNKEVIAVKAEESKEKEIIAIPIKTALVTKNKIDNTLQVTGEFEARQELTLVAESQGRIVRLKVKEGDYIRKGQQIAKLDDSALQSQLSMAQAAYQKALKDVERYSNLEKVGAISKLQLEEVQLGLKNAEANVASVRQQMQFSGITAPMSGIVNQRFVEQGSFVLPGNPVVEIVDISRLKMVVKVPETEVVKLKRGQKVSIQTDVYPETTFKGKVSVIGVKADQAKKYEVEIAINNKKSNPLKAGMYGMVQFEDTKAKESLFIPRTAIIGSLKDAKVYTIDSSKMAHLKSISTGEVIEDEVEVLTGLTENEEVVTIGQINLTEGKLTKVLN